MMKVAALALCVLAASATEPLSAEIQGGKLGSFLKIGAEVNFGAGAFAAARQEELSHVEQDPCAGCSDPHVVQYQKCSTEMAYNPCAKQYTGVAFDNHCCTIKEKHGRCLQCKSQGARPHYNSKWTDQLNSGVTVFEP